MRGSVEAPGDGPKRFSRKGKDLERKVSVGCEVTRGHSSEISVWPGLSDGSRWGVPDEEEVVGGTDPPPGHPSWLGWGLSYRLTPVFPHTYLVDSTQRLKGKWVL